ncbi:hypothetical protein KAZ82_00955 [Candidatus Babeliales bacterium]|nr:hypothetical protein [Candidatus Babeliales bacterium]
MVYKYFLYVWLLFLILSGITQSSVSVFGQLPTNSNCDSSSGSINKEGNLILERGCFSSITVLGDVCLKNVTCQTLTVTGCVNLENCRISTVHVQGSVYLKTSYVNELIITGNCMLCEAAADSVTVTGDLHVEKSAIKNVDYTGLTICLSKSFISDSIVVHTHGSDVPSISLDDVLVLGAISFDSQQLGFVQLMGQNSYVCPDRLVNSKVYRVQWN